MLPLLPFNDFPLWLCLLKTCASKKLFFILYNFSNCCPVIRGRWKARTLKAKKKENGGEAYSNCNNQQSQSAAMLAALVL